jgi:hypothetical protein
MSERERKGSLIILAIRREGEIMWSILFGAKKPQQLLKMNFWCMAAAGVFLYFLYLQSAFSTSSLSLGCLCTHGGEGRK